MWTYEYSGTPGYETIVNVPSKVGDKVAISLVCERKILTLAEVEVNVDFCPTINIPATHATVGDIKYDNQLSINGWFPAGTKATFQCPYNPLWRYSNETICQRLTGWDKDPKNECEPKVDRGFRLLPQSYDTCPSFMFLSKDNCKAAGLAVGAILQDGKVSEGSWSGVPFGCSINVNGGYIHYNSYRGENDGNYQPVCSKGSFTLLPKSFKGGCPLSMGLSKEGCAAAGLSAGGKLRDGNLVEGSWGHTPFGCFILPEDSAIHYNSNDNGVNDGRFESLCHELSVRKF